jgi:hypothetical protein
MFWLELIVVKVATALIACNPEDVSKPMSCIVIPKLTETAPVMLLMTETKPLIIKAQLNSSKFSEPYFRKLFPDMLATIMFRTVMKKKFNTIMLSVTTNTGSAFKANFIATTKTNKTIMGIKPILKSGFIFSIRPKLEFQKIQNFFSILHRKSSKNKQHLFRFLLAA